MEDQAEGLGLRLPHPAEEAASKTAQDTASVLASDAAEAMADEAAEEVGSDAAEEPEPDFPDGLRDESDGQRPATGEPRVDAALARLDELEGLPVTEHRAVFEDVHRRLRDVLGELDTGQPRDAGHAAGPAGRPGR
jgi:8-oxo-dGTP pyrophosphatase MutT (NUDIX family)